VFDPGARRPPARRRARILEANDLLTGRSRVAILTLGLAPIPHQPTQPTPLTTHTRKSPLNQRNRHLLHPTTQVAAPTHHTHHNTATQLPTHANTLVLPLPAVVLPVRRLRRARAGGRASDRPRPRAA